MIRLTNVTKEYDLPPDKPGRLVAADKLSFEVPKGEIFGLVGPNGAGKTTTLKMICGLMVPTTGTIAVNGIDVNANTMAAQEQIGYLADFFGVYDELKVWEYVEYFAAAYKIDPSLLAGRVKEVIAQLGLETKYDSLIGGLSRGMKQRLGIARAIVHQPPLLVLDEPASGLDPKARLELKELLKQLHRNGTTIFITSHVLADLEEICTSLGILEKGKLLRIGKIAEVMKSASQGRLVRMRAANADFSLEKWLAGRTDISEVKIEGTSAEFHFSGNDEELAKLVREAVLGGAAIFSVEEKTESLEALFSRLSSGEVM